MNKDYWKKKADDELNRNHNSILRFSLILDNLFNSFKDEIDEKIFFKYFKYLKNGNLKKILSQNELSDLKKFLNEHYNKINENIKLKNILKQHIKKIESYLERKSVTQTEDLLITFDVSLVELGLKEDELYTKELTETYEESYNRQSYDLALLLGFWLLVSENDMTDDIFDFWYDDNYRGRIWKNVNKTSFDMKQGFLRLIATNGSLDDLHKMIDKQMNTALNRSKMLCSSEKSNIIQKAKDKVYTDNKIVKFRYISSLWEKTCSICKSLDGLEFEMKDKQVGVNHPPMHPRCICTTIPIFDDGFVEEYERFAETKDGWITVPSTMTYDEWKNKYGIHLK